MTNIIIGNAIFLVGCIVNVLIGFVKDKKKILSYQCFQFVLMGVGNYVLNGISGAIANLISIIRNIFCLKKEYTNTAKYFFIIIQAALTIYFNNEGIVGYLPLASVCIYTFFLGLEDPKKFKVVLIITQAFWIVYDIIHLNIVSTIFGALTVISTSYTVYKMAKEERK